MNIVFWIAVVLFLSIIWFGLSVFFKLFGGLLYEIYKYTKEVINEVNEGEELK